MLRLLLIFTGTFLISCIAFAQEKFDQDSLSNPGPGSYKILNQERDSIIIPFTMHKGKPLLVLEINGEKAKLMIDNGVLWDPVWLFGSALVEELNLLYISNDSMKGFENESSNSLYAAENIELAFDDIIFYEQPVLVSPPAAGFAKVFPGVDGQLCNTFFRHFIVEFDFINYQIILHRPGGFEFPQTGSTLEMKLNESGTYSVPIMINFMDGKEIGNQVDIDLGGIYLLNIPLNNDLGIMPPSDAKERPFFNTTQYIAKIESLTIGNYRLKQPTVVFGNNTTFRILPRNIGVIGLPLFMNFKTIFNYFNYSLYLEPNENFGKVSQQR